MLYLRAFLRDISLEKDFRFLARNYSSAMLLLQVEITGESESACYTQYKRSLLAKSRPIAGMDVFG